jgi:hypothetical protein
MLWGQIHATGPADDRVIADTEARQPMTRCLATDGLLVPGLRRLPRGPVLPGSHARPGRRITARAVARPAGRQGPGGSGRSSVSLTCPAARSQPDGHLARRRPPDKPCRTQSTAGSGYVDDGITPSNVYAKETARRAAVPCSLDRLAGAAGDAPDRSLGVLRDGLDDVVAGRVMPRTGRRGPRGNMVEEWLASACREMARRPPRGLRPYVYGGMMEGEGHSAANSARSCSR